jgi:glucosamine-6-phosphate deaminase
VPISYGQKYAANGGNLIYVLDRIAGRELLANRGALRKRKAALEDCR